MAKSLEALITCPATAVTFWGFTIAMAAIPSGCASGSGPAWRAFTNQHPTVRWIHHPEGAPAVEHFLLLPGCVFLTRSTADIPSARVDGDAVLFTVSYGASCSGEVLGPESRKSAIDLLTGKPLPTNREYLHDCSEDLPSYSIRVSGADIWLDRGSCDDQTPVRLLTMRKSSFLQDGHRQVPLSGSRRNAVVFNLAGRCLICVNPEQL